MKIKLGVIFPVCVILSFLSACQGGPPAQTPILVSLSVPVVPPDYTNVPPSTSGSFSILPLHWSPTVAAHIGQYNHPVEVAPGRTRLCRNCVFLLERRAGHRHSSWPRRPLSLQQQSRSDSR